MVSDYIYLAKHVRSCCNGVGKEKWAEGGFKNWVMTIQQGSMRWQGHRTGSRRGYSLQNQECGVGLSGNLFISSPLHHKWQVSKQQQQRLQRQGAAVEKAAGPRSVQMAIC